MANGLDDDDIQGLVFRGYGTLRAAAYMLLAIDDAAAARRWLGSLVGEIRTGQGQAKDRALNVAITAPGLARLGLAPEALGGFAAEFTEGMATDHRARLLGDEEDSDRARWAWGGPATAEVHVLLMLFTRDQAMLSAEYAAQSRKAQAGGLREIIRLDTYDLGVKEHFGFHDGIAEPSIAGSWRPNTPLNTIAPGEFLLGYVNEHDAYTPRPLLGRDLDPRGILPHDAAGSGKSDLGRNGTYLVFRQLSQDVPGFWQFVDQATRNPDGSSNEAARTKLASQMIGRWPGGAPLTKSPNYDDPRLANFNDFAYYATDRYGYNCPIGAHIRRANPRDSLPPKPGSATSIEANKLHRIIRRGREYGPPVDPATLYQERPRSDDDERGLHFICLCGNIARQFEFIQHTWVMNPNFNGFYDSVDPILGLPGPGGCTFVIQDQPVRQRIRNVPRFINVRGGAYFFLPGIRALRYLASIGT